MAASPNCHQHSSKQTAAPEGLKKALIVSCLTDQREAQSNSDVCVEAFCRCQKLAGSHIVVNLERSTPATLFTMTVAHRLEVQASAKKSVRPCITYRLQLSRQTGHPRSSKQPLQNTASLAFPGRRIAPEFRHPPSAATEAHPNFPSQLFPSTALLAHRHYHTTF